MVISPTATGGHGARIKNSPIAIIELILDSLPKLGTPASVLFSYLQGNFVSDTSAVKYFQCPFNIEPQGLATHQQQIRSLVAKLER